MDDRDQATEADARESSALLFIGLMILLIGFFILLNNASRVENARSRAVMGSVTSTFDPTKKQPNAVHAFTADIGAVLQDGTLSHKLDALIETAFPLARVFEAKPGRVYEVDLPVSTMWIGESDDLSAPGRRFVAQSASILSRPPGGVVYRLESWLDPAEGAARAHAIQRVSNVANALVAAGAPREAVDSGLRMGKPTVIHLVFSVHPADGAAP
jgi:hypothetical protein